MQRTLSEVVDSSPLAEKKLLRPQQAADFLTIGLRTLWRLKATGELAHVQIRGSVRFRQSDLERFIDDRVVSENS